VKLTSSDVEVYV